MYRRILFATDFTQQSAEAQKAAIAFAKAFGANVEILHAIEPIPGAEDHTFDDFYEELETRAEEALRRIARVFEAAGISAKGTVVVERRWKAIVDRADPRRIDLVILGGAAPTEARGTGTTSHQVFLMSRVPVLSVRKQRKPRERRERKAKAPAVRRGIARPKRRKPGR